MITEFKQTEGEYTMSITLTPKDFDAVYDLDLSDEEYGDLAHGVFLAIIDGDLPEEINYLVNELVDERGLEA